MSIDPRMLKAPNPAQFDEYEKPRPLLPAGRYTGQAPMKVQIEGDDEGNIRAILDPIQIVGVPSEFRDQIRFERLSSKPRLTGRLKGTSRMTDYLLATGTEPVRSDDAEVWIQALEGTAGQHFEFFLDWRAYDKETEEVLAQSYDEFPPDDNGGRLPFVVNPKTGKRVAAQYRIRYYIRQRR